LRCVLGLRSRSFFCARAFGGSPNSNLPARSPDTQRTRTARDTTTTTTLASYIPSPILDAAPVNIGRRSSVAPLLALISLVNKVPILTLTTASAAEDWWLSRSRLVSLPGQLERITAVEPSPVVPHHLLFGSRRPSRGARSSPDPLLVWLIESSN
jgi:hypothetical protein